MNNFFGPHPALIAFLLGLGGFMLSFYAYDYFFQEHNLQSNYWNKDLISAGEWTQIAVSVVAWLAGGICFGIHYGVRWPVSLLLHLLPVVGLLLIRLVGRRLTPHDLWARENPGLDEKTAKRTYRSMKPLY